MKKKEPEMRLIYHFNEPEADVEKEDQQQDIDAAYDILFEAVLRSENGIQ
ncbi:MAG: hypothetical protein Q7S50_01195 [bacterium]|nr:hypothetical protein [bacterium]